MVNICNWCNKPIKDDEKVFQVRIGWMDKDDFQPEEDVYYFHSGCFDAYENDSWEFSPKYNS